jgi:hypothetical protein
MKVGLVVCTNRHATWVLIDDVFYVTDVQLDQVTGDLPPESLLLDTC